MNKFNFLIIGVSLTSVVFGMQKNSSPITIKREFSIAVVGKDESDGFLARRKSSGSSKDNSNSPSRYSSRSHLSSSPEFPCGVIDGKVIPSQKSLVQQDKK